MENEIVESEKTILTARQIRAQVNLIQEVMKAVMKKDVHYGIIPGCPKPTLFKAGAEKIAATFKIAIRSEVEDLSTSDEKHFRVTCTGFSPSGLVLGSAIGECSSNEEKFKWRSPVCKEEFEECDIDRKREKWVKGYGDKPPYKKQQIRTEPADLANTILQLADKRGYVAVVRKITAASDVFTQDIEDLPAEIAAEMDGKAPLNTKPAVEMPKAKQPSPGTVTTAFNVLDAMAQPVDSMISVWGVFFDYKVEQVGKNKKDITRYKLSPREGTQLITISMWGRVQEGLALGDVIQFNGVVVKDYKGEKQYLGTDIIVLEKVKAEEDINA